MLVVFFIIDVLIVYDLKPCTEEVVPFLRRLIPKDHSIVEKIPGNDPDIPRLDLLSGEIGVQFQKNSAILLQNSLDFGQNGRSILRIQVVNNIRQDNGIRRSSLHTLQRL